MSQQNPGLWLFPIIGLFAVAPVRAVEGELQPTIEVTATRVAETVDASLADVSIITRRDIEASGSVDLIDLLRLQAGVDVARSGGAGEQTSVFIRGTNANHVLVLIDGVRVASSNTGAFAFENLPLDAIERIEIVRGPRASYWGSDAIGGVIQVFTRKPATALQANATAGYGTHDTVLGTAGVSGGNDVMRGSLQIGARRSAGFNSIVNPANFAYDPDRDGYRDHDVSAQGALTLATGHEASAQFFRSRLDNQFDAGDGFDDRTVTTLTAWQLALRDRFLPAWESRVSAGEGEDESVSKLASGDSPFRTRQRQYAWQNEVSLDAAGATHRVTVAVERREERVATDPPFPVTLRTTNSVTAVYSGTIDAHVLQANLRSDDSNQFGNRTTGALAYGYRISPQWRITASAGTAFKAPTFNDLYFPGFSNPGLRPETARNVEAGAYYTTSLAGVRVDAHAVAWHNRVRDLIVFQCDVDFNCAPQNVSDATLKGVTLGVDAVAERTSAHLSVDLQSPRDDATGHLLPRRARRHGALGVLHQAGPVSLGAEVVASSRRFDDAENLRPLGGYAILNLTAEWPVTATTTLFLRADNVFDRNYELAADFSTGGARIFGGVRWRL